MKLLKNTDMNNKKIVNLDSPTLPDAVIKKYVDEKNTNNRFIRFFVKMCKHKSLYWGILVSHRPQLKQ